MTAADTITSAQLSIDFEPCTDCGTVTNPVKVDIFFDNYLALNDWSGSSGHPDDISAVDVLSYVLSDHNLNLTMRYPSAGFWVNGISLSGEYSPAVSITAFNNSVPVPEPANMIALGVFLLGMVAVSRKRFLTKK